MAADLAHVAWAVNLGCLGFHVWPNEAGRPRSRRRAAHRSRPATGRDLRRRARRGGRDPRALRRARHRGAPEDHGQPRHPRVRAPRARVDADRGARRRGRDGARARPPAPRPDHRRMVEGRARRTCLHRLQPERAAQDGVRRVVGAGAPRRAGVDAVRLGRARAEIEPDALTIATVPPRVAEQGDPWAGIGERPQSLVPLLEMSARDLASGLQDAPWPPVYPKMPGEPPRRAQSAKKPAAKKPARSRRRSPARSPRPPRSARDEPRFVLADHTLLVPGITGREPDVR